MYYRSEEEWYKAFKDVVKRYDKLVHMAMELGYTKDQAIEFVKIWCAPRDSSD